MLSKYKINALYNVFNNMNQVIDFHEDNYLTIKLPMGMLVKQLLEDITLDDTGNSVLDTEETPYILLKQEYIPDYIGRSFSVRDDVNVVSFIIGKDKISIPTDKIKAVVFSFNSVHNTAYIHFEYEDNFAVRQILSRPRIIAYPRHPLVTYDNNVTMTMDRLLDMLMNIYNVSVDVPEDTSVTEYKDVTDKDIPSSTTDEAEQPTSEVEEDNPEKSEEDAQEEQEDPREVEEITLPIIQ